MPEERDTGAVYVFGDVRVDRRRFQIVRAGRAVPLEPRAFDLLILLVESQGRVLTKREILDRLWTDTAVTDNALTRIVAQLRKALADDAKDARYIETVPTRGYRWIAEMRPEIDSQEAQPFVPVRPARRFSNRTIIIVAVVAVVTMSAIAGLTDWRTLPAMSRSPVSVRPVQLTVSPGLDTFPSFSPDGQLIAYATDRHGGFEIAARALAGGAAERAVTADGQQNVQAAWSPDGSAIAYHSRKRGGIWIVAALGGVPRQISEFGSRPAWSADGQRIAFQSDPCNDISPMGYSANIPSLIWIMDRDGGRAEPLTRAAAPIGAHGSPSWSPDGSRILFVVSAAGPLQVWTMPVRGGEPSRVSGMEGVLDAVFAPDGRVIYGATGNPAVLALPISRNSGVAIGSPRQVVMPGISSVRHLTITRDGRHMAFTGMELESHLWTLPMDGDVASGAPVPLTDERGLRQTEPAFSPSGDSLAFWSIRQGRGGEIWIVDAAGGPAAPVTIPELFSPTQYTRPSWMPDGHAVVFLAHESGSARAVTVDLASRRETTLVEVEAVGGPGTRFPAWDVTISPDASTAAYSQIDPATGRSRLFVRSIGDGLVRAVTSGESSERYPVWSADSRSLAFEMKQEDATHIAVVPASGGEPRRVTSERWESWPYGWSPDGDKVLFAGIRDGIWNLWWVSLSTGRQSQLTGYVSANTFVRYPTWSPRRDRIAYERGSVTGNIWITQLEDAALHD